MNPNPVLSKRPLYGAMCSKCFRPAAIEVTRQNNREIVHNFQADGERVVCVLPNPPRVAPVVTAGGDAA